MSNYELKVSQIKPGVYRVYTPVVTLGFPHLTDPDTGGNGFTKQPEYVTEFKMPASGAEYEQLLDVLRAAISEFHESETARLKGKQVNKSKNKPFTLKDGDAIFKAKLKAVVHLKDGTSFEQAPQLFDENGKVWDRSKRGYIANGSKAIVCFETIPYNLTTAGGVGVTLRLKGVKVVEAADSKPAGGSDTAVAEGFGIDAAEAERALYNVNASNAKVRKFEQSEVAGVPDDFEDIPF